MIVIIFIVKITLYSRCDNVREICNFAFKSIIVDLCIFKLSSGISLALLCEKKKDALLLFSVQFDVRLANETREIRYIIHESDLI